MPTWLYAGTWVTWVLWSFFTICILYAAGKPGRTFNNTGRLFVLVWIVGTPFWICWNIWG